MHALLLLTTLLAAGDDALGNDLHGKVRGAEGQPLTGATAFVYSARPRVGKGVLCPYCYADCRKHAESDAEGKFVLPKLDPTLLFQILVVAEGYRPTLASKVDPQAGPLEVQLEPLPTGLKPDQQLRGRVVDPEGQPIRGAVVEPSGIKTAEKRWWGQMPGVDQKVIANAQGEFLVVSDQPAQGFDLEITAPGYAKGLFALVSTGTEVHPLKLTRGATVCGRIVEHGAPVAGLAVGLVQTDRGAGSFVGAYNATTDSEGRFTFANVHPNDSYYLSTKMATTAEHGVLSMQEIRVGADDSTLELNDLALEPTHRLAGRVRLTDGQPLPAGARLLVSRDEAWDSQQLTLPPDGSFSLAAVPTEAIELIPGVPGYRLAPRGNRFQQTRPGTLALFLDGDRIEVEILLEPVPPRSSPGK